MKARRKEAGAGCFCTHESNCLLPVAAVQSRAILIKIKKLEGQMKKAARK